MRDPKESFQEISFTPYHPIDKWRSATYNVSIKWLLVTKREEEPWYGNCGLFARMLS
jgi:hypothetical protein